MSLPKARLHLSKDKVLKNIIDSTEILKLDQSGDVFNELVKAIIYQQISYKAADSIYNKFTSHLGSINYGPGHILERDHETLRSLGLSNQKAGYVRNIAEFFMEQQLMDTDWSKYSDEEITNLLTQIKGVGEWTVHMILIFELQREDIFPVKDLAIQQVMKQLYGLKEEKSQLITRLNNIALEWQPFRSYASLYLWSWKRANY